MKRGWILGALLAAALAGCSQGGAPAPTASETAAAAGKVKVAYELGTIKKGDKAHCVVCVIKEGSREEEPVAETVDYKGRTYAFCNESEKAEFISDPARYAGASP